jgi:hypothetical protein
MKEEDAEDAHVDLLDVVRRRVLSLEIPLEYPSGIPVAELGAMPLKDLLGLIRTLGRHSVSASSGATWADPRVAVLEASRILSQWPFRFRELLARLEPNSRATKPLYLTGSRHRGLYGSLSRGRAEFAVREISDYAASRHGALAKYFWPVYHDDRSAKDRSEISKAFVSKSELAKMFEVDWGTPDDIVVVKGLPMTTNEVAKALGCTVYAVRQLAILGKLPGKRIRKTFIFGSDVVEGFKRQYVFLASLARDLLSTANRLMKIARKRGVNMDWILDKNFREKYAFILVEDIPRILSVA